LINSPSFSELKGKELRPGPVDLPDFVNRFGESAYHPSGTCRMGRDGDAVVAPDGVVNGVSGLRVVDASIMPEITNGNLNAVVIMMAEKISAQILER
jgi:choline dehydrogenase